MVGGCSNFQERVRAVFVRTLGSTRGQLEKSTSFRFSIDATVLTAWLVRRLHPLADSLLNPFQFLASSLHDSSVTKAWQCSNKSSLMDPDAFASASLEKNETSKSWQNEMFRWRRFGATRTILQMALSERKEQSERSRCSKLLNTTGCLARVEIISSPDIWEHRRIDSLVSVSLVSTIADQACEPRFLQYDTSSATMFLLQRKLKHSSVKDVYKRQTENRLKMTM